MKDLFKTPLVLNLLAGSLVLLALAFIVDLWGKPPQPANIPLADAKFADPALPRVSAEELFRTGGDTSMLECYGCHDRSKALELEFDDELNVILPEEHEDIIMAHGQHKRNNNCFNCHDDQNLEQLQTRDHRQLKISESADLCGSCHGPTYRDWMAGIHGRVNGFWDASLGERKIQTCVSCHDPHQPKFPPRRPAPGPNPIRATTTQQKAH